MQAGLRTRHITTVAITTACRNATHSANLHANDDDDDDDDDGGGGGGGDDDDDDDFCGGLVLNPVIKNIDDDDPTLIKSLQETNQLSIQSTNFQSNRPTFNLTNQLSIDNQSIVCLTFNLISESMVKIGCRWMC